ncbi:unnamed protein product, partial [Porites evermanni]
YFKTPRKCGIFGVCCEAIPRQLNFLIDESVLTGKGANSTISYVHIFFEKHGLGEKNAQHHADNSGHTKFEPDWCFGLLKQRTRRTFISSLFDIGTCVEESASVNVAEL